MWGDKWIPRPWTFKVTSLCSLQPSTKVSELMISPGVWNGDLIRASFLSHDVEAILSIPLANGYGHDTVIWYYRKDGRYLVSSGYRLAMDVSNVVSRAGEGCSNDSKSIGMSFWSKIWRLKVVNKVKLFIWRACNNFIPCAANLVSRKIGHDSRCLRCGAPEESSIHALWYCKAAQQVWKHTFLWVVCKHMAQYFPKKNLSFLQLWLGRF